MSIIPQPENCPKIGEIYQHFKSADMKYEIIDIIYDTNIDNYAVLYKPLYECEYKLFSCPLSQWFEIVERDGNKYQRFIICKEE